MNKLTQLALSALSLSCFCDQAYAANYIRSGNVVEKEFKDGRLLVFGKYGDPPSNNNNCGNGDKALTFDLMPFIIAAGSQFDVNKIYVDGFGGSGDRALAVWLTDWDIRPGYGRELPALNVTGGNWQVKRTVSFCVGSSTQTLTSEKGLKSIVLWYDEQLSVNLYPYPETRPVGVPMNMSDPSDSLTVSGNGNRLRDLNGYGINTIPTEAPVASKPDFEVKKVWLTTPGGVEQYTYNFNDEVKMNAQFENTGPGSIPGSSYVYSRFYLSRGYKEDAHSDWVRVGTDQTLGNNLDPGETHSEQEGLNIWNQDIIKPGGTYNIVVCIDRTADSGNGNGDWVEKHESNNCSTEAVFTVNGSFNFKVNTLTLSTGTTALAPGQIFDITSVAQNIGANNAAIDTRIGYYLSGPNITGDMLIGTNQIKEANFAAGVSKTEILNGITAPSNAGTFTLKACTDYDDRVVETNETDNCKTVTFTVATPSTPNPAPKKTTPAVTEVLFGS